MNNHLTATSRLGLALLVTLAACAAPGAGGDVALRADSLRQARAQSPVATSPAAPDTTGQAAARAAAARGGLQLTIHLATSASSETPAPGQLLLTTPDGRGEGFLPGRGSVHEIPGAVYDSSGTDDDTPNAKAAGIVADQRQIEGVTVDTGTYRLTVSGTGPGSYVLSARIDSVGSPFTATQQVVDTRIRAGESQQFRILVGPRTVRIERVP